MESQRNNEQPEAPVLIKGNQFDLQMEINTKRKNAVRPERGIFKSPNSLQMES